MKFRVLTMPNVALLTNGFLIHIATHGLVLTKAIQNITFRIQKPCAFLILT